ncbi:MAG: translation initiation factor IF-2 subunit beta [Candidatus Altiarchaeota archaeon]|nr:translation initiation factor IF-2 subunit beta [Candidatus Altiarchaeota archaeon]
MEYDYVKLLDRAWNSLPDELRHHERFVMPQANTYVEGNQTIIRNFSEIADLLGRDPKHLFTFLLKELAAPGTLEGSRVIIQRVLRKHIIDKRIGDYANEYVICHECGKPDTKFTELEGQKIIKCAACGGWRPLRKIK